MFSISGSTTTVSRFFLFPRPTAGVVDADDDCADDCGWGGAGDEDEFVAEVRLSVRRLRAACCC